MPTLAPLADDGGIAQAIGALDAKLGSFVDAWQVGQLALVELARKAGVAATVEPPPRPRRGLLVTDGAGETTRPAETAPAAPAMPAPSAAPPSAAPQPAAPQPDAVDDDEALLRTLDPETANAIRVKRRLGKRSVRELLDEMKSPKSGAKDSAAGKKRWR